MKNVVLFFVLLFTVSCTQGDKDLTYKDVAERMVDAKRLAELPAEGEKSGQFRFQLNEGALEGQINFHHAEEDEDEDVRKIDLGIIDMEEGQQDLVFEWLEKQSEGGRLSLGYLEFTSVK